MTVTLVGVLAVGIAANVVVFQCVDRLVLDPLPLPAARDIVVVGSEMPSISQPVEYFEPFSGPELAEITAGSRTLVGLLPFDMNSVRMQGPDFPVRLFGGFVWADPLPVLGVEPALGRTFTGEELARGDAVAILSQAAWTRDFGSDATVVGRSVELDGVPHVVVGVLPEYATLYGVDVWLPMGERLETLPRDRRQFNLMGRVAPGGDLDAVNAELAAMASLVERRWGREDAAYVGWRLQATSFARNNAFAYADEAVLTMVASLLILLLISVNLGNLALVRGVQRRGGAATRLALGSPTALLVRDVAGEAAVLGLMGGGLGMAVAAGTFGALNRSLPGVLQPLGPPLALDGSGVAFGAAATLGAVLVLAAASAGALRGVTARGVLAGGTRSHGTRGLRTVQRGLVSAQFALGLALASGAGAVGSAVARVLLEDPGFAVDEVVSMRLSLPADAYAGDAVPLFFRNLMDGVAGVPGVSRTAIATQVAPNTFFSSEIEVEGGDVREGARPRLFHTVVAGSYFQAMGIPVVEGRALDDRDRMGSPPVVVLNQAAAKRLFPGLRAVGQRIRVRGTGFDSGWAEVVGISADVGNQGQGRPPAPRSSPPTPRRGTGTGRCSWWRGPPVIPSGSCLPSAPRSGPWIRPSRSTPSAPPGAP